MSEVHKCNDYEYYDIDGDYYSLNELREFIRIATSGDGH